MKYIKQFENNANPKFEKDDIVYLQYKNLRGPLEYGKPYVIKLCDLNYYPSIYYEIEGVELNYQFPESILISEDEYLEKIAGEYNL